MGNKKSSEIDYKEVPKSDGHAKLLDIRKEYIDLPKGKEQTVKFIRNNFPDCSPKQYMLDKLEDDNNVINDRYTTTNGLVITFYLLLYNKRTKKTLLCNVPVIPKN